MIIFWISIITMTLLALGFLIFPLFKNQQKRQKIITIVGIMLALPILAISLYWKLGAYESVEKQQQVIRQNNIINTEIQKLGSLQNIVLALKQKVDANPDGRGFLLLGRLYLKTQQFKEATEVFSKANQLTPNQPEILVGYAESLYFLNQQNLTTQAKGLLEQVLKLQSSNPDAINLLAMDAYQRGNYALAVRYWQELLPQFPSGSSEQKKLLEMIKTAQKKRGSPSIQLNVQVSLVKSLQGKINPNDTLFIYAQALKGSKIPLAITRKQVRDLPLQVVLDENMAMLPTNTLINHDQILVIARVSKSGQAVAVNGDLQGESVKINLKDQPARIEVVIDKVIRDIREK